MVIFAEENSIVLGMANSCATCIFAHMTERETEEQTEGDEFVI